MKTSISLIIITVLAASLFGANAFAGPHGRGGPWAVEDDDQWNEINERIKTMRTLEMVETLGLSQDEALALVPKFSEIDQQRRELALSERGLHQTIKAEFDKSTPNEKTLAEALDQLQSNHKKRCELREDEVELARKNLTVEQQAKFVLFSWRFGQKIMKKINKARWGDDGPGKGGGHGRGGGCREIE